MKVGGQGQIQDFPKGGLDENNGGREMYQVAKGNGTLCCLPAGGVWGVFLFYMKHFIPK